MFRKQITVSSRATMAGQSTPKAAVTTLRKAIGRDKKHAVALNRIRDAFDSVVSPNLASHL